MEKGFKKYIEWMEYIQSHPEYRLRYDAYFKNVTDEANRLYTAKREGEREGYLKGIKKAEQKIVKNCLDRGLTVEQIEEMVGFDPRPYID
jgi:predicted transposase/invertase (TIGR01784 family)